MIPVYRPYLSGKEKEYVNHCLDSSWISSRGEYINRFENSFAEYTGASHATSVCNGTVALHLALMALGIGPGDEVILPALTYIASVNTILQVGATAVFADSLESTWQIDPKDVRSKITPRTRAIMAVHLYGQACDMDALTAICREHHLYLVEDCAEAFGSLYHGKHVGTFGDIATFSFFGNKTITTGEGGMLISNNPAVIKRAYSLKTQGVSPTREYWHEGLGYNYRMTNICAAIGLAQLEEADNILARKRQIAAWYAEQLGGLPLRTHAEVPGTIHSFWMCSILLDDGSLRQALRDHLQRAGVETRPLFHPAHHMEHCLTDDALPVAESLSNRGINLPSYPALGEREVRLICATIHGFFSEELV